MTSPDLSGLAGNALLEYLISTADDERALAQLYALTSGRLNALLRRMLRDDGAAAEVLQDVYVTVWKRGTTYDPARSTPMTWLFTVARNKAIDRLRADRTDANTLEPGVEENVRDPGVTAIERLEWQDDLLRLHDCLTTLDANQRSAIRAAYFDAFTYQALATRAAVPLSTMKSWIRRGLMQLRTCLERKP